MKLLLKRLLLQLKYFRNKINWSTTISFNSVLGKHNQLYNSTLVHSKIGNNNKLNFCSLISSQVSDSCSMSGQIFDSILNESIIIGNNSLLSNCVIGRYTYLSGNNRMFYTNIGSFCSIAENVIIGHAEHPTHRISTSPLFYKKNNPFQKSDFVCMEENEFQQTVIGNDVWIGVNAYVKSGVVIGDGAIIGAGTIVTKDVEPYAIMAGVPAKFIRKRFDDETIQLLLKFKWWNMCEEDLKKNANLFKYSLNKEILINQGVNNI